MRTIEVRRHALTKKGDGRGKGSHLSAEGVAQARNIGASLGRFDLVLTSQIPRTLETALAMGFAVDDQLAALGEIPAAVWDEIGHQERWAWKDPFAQFARFAAAGGPTAEMGKRQKAIWQTALESVPDDGCVLIVSHGRVIESGLVTCLPSGDFAAWGGPFHHGEGFQLTYDDGAFSSPQLRRNPRDAST
ncbi:MAG: histidine phosphatase family protein [Armatimonadota bacterium]